MYCIITGHGFINEVQSASQIFFPNEKFITVTEPVANGITIRSELRKDSVLAVIYKDGLKFFEISKPVLDASVKILRNTVQRSVFEACMSFGFTAPPWGLIVGIRPTKIVHEMWKKNFSNAVIKKRLREFYLLTEEKAALCVKAAEAGGRFLSLNTDDTVSLYIGIPFCVSRCLYCSFSSYIMSKYEKSADAYIDALAKELDEVRRYIVSRRKVLQTIYIGGGTPVSLGTARLERLLSLIAEMFDVSAVLEYTIEAGRPDAIDRAKLNIIKSYGVGRVCVNPQTLNDKTLKAIGREHTAEDFYRAFDLAAGMGFTVNVDLLMGLTGETPDDAKNTLAGISALQPDNLTIHTLSVKRASKLKEQLSETVLTQAADVYEMLKQAEQTAYNMGMKPYYMYRQKNTLGNFENVGYCKENKECIYNIQIIEEKQTIIAVGAGAATKHVDRNRNLVRRIYNVKTPEEYINRIDEMTERKNKLYEYDDERP